MKTNINPIDRVEIKRQQNGFVVVSSFPISNNEEMLRRWARFHKNIARLLLQGDVDEKTRG